MLPGRCLRLLATDIWLGGAHKLTPAADKYIITGVDVHDYFESLSGHAWYSESEDELQGQLNKKTWGGCLLGGVQWGGVCLG